MKDFLVFAFFLLAGVAFASCLILLAAVAGRL